MRGITEETQKAINIETRLMKKCNVRLQIKYYVQISKDNSTLLLHS